MINDEITRLLPLLSGVKEPRFNLFDVMHHGTHEKQLSNVFAWLLDETGTHQLGDKFQRIFINEVNHNRTEGDPFGYGPYVVRQEVNTAGIGDADIADILLESDKAVLVIENYFTSDGHVHGYDTYLGFGGLGGRDSGVVLLCRDRDNSLLTKGWEKASVVTYGALIEQLHTEVRRDRHYQRKHPDSFSFIDQLHRKYVKGRSPMDDRQVLDFVTTMCTTGEAQRYQTKSPQVAAKQFAEDVAQAANERFLESRDLLLRIKQLLRRYGDNVLRHQLNETLGEGFVSPASVKMVGRYQWTVLFDIPDKTGYTEEAPLQLKFGPSAWWANEHDNEWVIKVDKRDVDYSHLFLTRAATREVRQSAVTLQEVLDGLSPKDHRLHDEVLNLLGPDIMSTARPEL